VDENGVLRYRNYDVGWIDVTDPADVSRAYRIGRRYVWRGGETPRTTHFTSLGPQLGVREGRRIVGDYVLRQDDLLLDRRFDDVVMRCHAHLENHSYDYANESELAQIWIGVLGQWKFLFGGDVPYRSLLPAGIDGLLIGCRALSQDHDCGNLLRMQRDMQKLGEVAGVAAALSVRYGVTPRALDVRRLQRRLVERGVLRAEDLTRPSEPWLAFAGEARSGLQRVLEQGVSDEDVRAAVARLGTDEEPAALWRLMRYGDRAVPALRAALTSAAGDRRRGIGFALGLLKDPAGVPVLADTFRRRDGSKPNDLDRTMERWKAALVLLGRMADPAVCDDVLELLPAERDSTTLLLLLHYLIAVSDRLTPGRKARAIPHLQAIIADPDIGGDYTLHGSGTSIPATAETRSIKWSLDVNAAYLLERIGGDGRRVLERYAADERGYVREAARRMLARLAGRRPEAPQRRAPIPPPDKAAPPADRPPAGAAALFDGAAFDAVVAGGGLAGAAAALNLAAAGMRVAIVEPTGALGREIARGRNLFADLPVHADRSPSIRAFLDALRERGGWFDGAMDPIAAAIAWDDLMERRGVRVLFDVHPAGVMVDGRRVAGLTVVTKTGYGWIRAPRVVDATVYGKPSAPWFRRWEPDADAPRRTVLHLMFNSVAGDGTAEDITLAADAIADTGTGAGAGMDLGELRVRCRPTYWEGERRVTLACDRLVPRSAWIRNLPSLIPALQRHIPALKTGIFACAAEEVWRTPEFRTAAAADGRRLGFVQGADGRPHALTLGMVADPAVVAGLYLAGPWLAQFPFDPLQEEAALVNLFLLGDAVGRALLGTTDADGSQDARAADQPS
jgi:HEAT repeat protein